METAGNQDLKLAFDFVRYTSRNIFLTGKAGTGKTTFLRELKKLSPKRQVIVAPTGVAAINAGGVTIHSFFQLPFHPYIPTFYFPEKSRRKIADQDDPAGYKMSREKINIIRSLDLLIIDEISMVRADTLDAIDSALRRYKNRNLPFGGIQLLMIGDLQQLAPVVKDEDREVLKDFYESYFFFGSRALARADYVTIELKHIYRQTDQNFISLLNKVRDNHIDTEVLAELNKRYIPGFDPDTGGGYITLTTHNNQAKAINDSRLGRLPGKEHSFMAIIRDEFPELSYPNEAELILKKGAQVMFVKNDLSPEKLFFNGKIGKIEGFEEETIVVRCPEDELPIYVEKAEWQNMRYTLDEDTKELEETVIGTFTQYPLRLAWAITIHKSQGLTFDRAVIDARAAFAHGQVYVALSRCRTLGGLVLSSHISQRSIIDNPVISGFIRASTEKQPGPAQLAESKKAFQLQLLAELFDFNELIYRLSYCVKIIDEHQSSLSGVPRDLAVKAVSGLRDDLAEVAQKFLVQIKELSVYGAEPELNEPLRERVMKATEFFSGKLEDMMKEIIDGISVDSDNRTVRKSVDEAFERARKEVIIKLKCLDSVKSGFRVSCYLDARAKAAIDIPSLKKIRGKSENAGSVNIKHPALFSLLKEWRIKTALDSDKKHYHILHQKTLLSLANELPLTMTDLRKIKGVGKKKAEKFGRELLEIIRTYCSSCSEILPPESSPGSSKSAVKKEDTRMVSLDLFRKGNTIAQIAELRRLSESTVENHLARFVASGEIPVTELIDQETLGLIMSYFEECDDTRLGPAKEVLGEAVTWGDLRFTVSHLMFISKSGN